MNIIPEIFSVIGRFLLSCLEYVNIFDFFSFGKNDRDSEDNGEVYENPRFKQ